jgi:hypothetical protein
MLSMQGAFAFPSWLAIRPGWDKRLKTVLPDQLTLQALFTVRVCSDLCGGVDEARSLVGLSVASHPYLAQHQINLTSVTWNYWPESFVRLVQTLEQFHADPASVFQRSQDHCSCCRRKLTDQVSRLRGIGPECWERVQLFFQQGASATN